MWPRRLNEAGLFFRLFLKYSPVIVPPLAEIELHGAEGVDKVTLVRVDGDTEEAGVGVDQLILVSDHGDPEDTSVTEESEVSHVLVDLVRTLKY